MVKLDLTAILYSKKNYDLSYKLRKWCRGLNINLVTIFDFVELTIKTIQLNPQIIFCDCSTVEFTSGNIRVLIDNKDYNKAQIIFIGEDDSLINQLKQVLNDDLIFVKPNDIPAYLESMETDLRIKANLTEIDKVLEKRINENVCRCLCCMGLSQRHSGYAFVKDIIVNIILNNGVVHSLVSDQYPFVAAKFKTSVVNVERNIRNAIYSAWNFYGQNHWKGEFFSKTIELGKKPTNREFIFMCVDKIMNDLKQDRFHYAG